EERPVVLGAFEAEGDDGAFGEAPVPRELEGMRLEPSGERVRADGPLRGAGGVEGGGDRDEAVVLEFERERAGGSEGEGRLDDDLDRISSGQEAERLLLDASAADGWEHAGDLDVGAERLARNGVYRGDRIRGHPGPRPRPPLLRRVQGVRRRQGRPDREGRGGGRADEGDDRPRAEDERCEEPEGAADRRDDEHPGQPDHLPVGLDPPREGDDGYDG